MHISLEILDICFFFFFSCCSLRYNSCNAIVSALQQKVNFKRFPLLKRSVLPGVKLHSSRDRKVRKKPFKKNPACLIGWIPLIALDLFIYLLLCLPGCSLNLASAIDTVSIHSITVCVCITRTRVVWTRIASIFSSVHHCVFIWCISARVCVCVCKLFPPLPLAVARGCTVDTVCV